MLQNAELMRIGSTTRALTRTHYTMALSPSPATSFPGEFALRFALLGCVLLMVPHVSSAQPAVPAAASGLAAQDPSLEQLVDDLYASRGATTPGAQVLIVQGGEVLLRKRYGLANLEHRVAVTDSTVFDLASVAKMFTGYALAALAERGALDTEADIRQYLPDFPDYGHRITVRHLLHHTSGLRNWTNLIQYATWSSKDRITTDGLLQLIYAQEGLNFTPGTQYQYSNSGYVLLAEIVARVSGESLPRWLAANVFEPLGMRQTLMNDDPARIIPHLAQGYYLDDRLADARDFNNTAALGSSSLFSNAEDMRKWMAFLLDPPADKAPIVARMMTTQPLNDGAENSYAYGIDVSTYEGAPYITHSGSWVSHTSCMLLLPEQDVAIFFAHNYPANTYRIARRLADYFVLDAPSTAATPAPAPVLEPPVVPTKLLDEYAGLYELGPAWYLRIVRDGDRLLAKAIAEPAFMTYPENDSTFVVPAYRNRTLTFTRDPLGAVDALYYNNKRRPRTTEAVFASDRHMVRPLLGTYFSHELGMVFELSYDDDRLWANNVRTGPMLLLQVEGDTYVADGVLGRVRFQRGEGGTVTGFTMTDSREVIRWTFRKAD